MNHVVIGNKVFRQVVGGAVIQIEWLPPGLLEAADTKGYFSDLLNDLRTNSQGYLEDEQVLELAVLMEWFYNQLDNNQMPDDVVEKWWGAAEEASAQLAALAGDIEDDDLVSSSEDVRRLAGGGMASLQQIESNLRRVVKHADNLPRDAYLAFENAMKKLDAVNRELRMTVSTHGLG